MVSIEIRQMFLERGLPTRVSGRKAHGKCGSFRKPDTEIYLCKVLEGDEPWDWIGIDAAGETVACAMTRRECAEQIRAYLQARRERQHRERARASHEKALRAGHLAGWW